MSRLSVSVVELVSRTLSPKYRTSLASVRNFFKLRSSGKIEVSPGSPGVIGWKNFIKDVCNTVTSETRISSLVKSLLKIYSFKTENK